MQLIRKSSVPKNNTKPQLASEIEADKKQNQFQFDQAYQPSQFKSILKGPSATGSTNYLGYESADLRIEEQKRMIQSPRSRNVQVSDES